MYFASEVCRVSFFMENGFYLGKKFIFVLSFKRKMSWKIHHTRLRAFGLPLTE